MAAIEATAAPAQGLTQTEARSRLASDGPNSVADTAAHPLRDVLAKFWAPVPWMLEAAVLLQVGMLPKKRSETAR